MKGNSGLYDKSKSNPNIPISGIDYNSSNSNLIKQVNSVNVVINAHSLPATSEPNSVTKKYTKGSLNSERYYDSNGNAYLDIDYTNHGNPKTHPNVPHQHKISIVDGKIKREKEDIKCN